ncbi:hypothetical protein OLMES_1924 [Oleiphilus messinensis]|uniref:DNA gyrase inhibitor YacG n=2 Tax=Oleiphilus messinensis TaxID=141451 RepID=A0A1Y0I683_9GAMM|nr:hypothetical protein OLMES_1924 [Oleiphilus messinensis]
MVEWSDDFPHRPFCSKRCQLIDLGCWADESYAISEPAIGLEDENLEEPSENNNGWLQ